MNSLVRPDRYPRSSRYDPSWVRELDMGPHPLWQLEDLLPNLRRGLVSMLTSLEDDQIGFTLGQHHQEIVLGSGRL